jgi:hypothetical protein
MQQRSISQRSHPRVRRLLFLESGLGLKLAAVPFALSVSALFIFLF